jgi:hypothetical protein
MTELVSRAVEGRIAYSAFAHDYGSYFWEAALDGHELGEPTAILAGTHVLVPLHAAVQAILDAVYEGPADLPPGSDRISSAAAELRLKELGTLYNIPKALDEAHMLRKGVRQRSIGSQ